MVTGVQALKMVVVVLVIKLPSLIKKSWNSTQNCLRNDTTCLPTVTMLIV